MPNKYLVRVPYSYLKYGEMSCIIYAEDEDELEDLVTDFSNRHAEDYDDSDNDGDNEYSYDQMTVELEEEDVDEPVNIYNQSESEESPFSKIPDYFLAELLQL